MWGMGWLRHRAAVRPWRWREDVPLVLKPPLLVRVPYWLSLLCGQPLEGNKVNVGSMVIQIGALVAGLVWLLGVMAGLDFRIAAIIYVFMLMGIPVLAGHIETLIQGKRTRDN